MDPSPLVRSFDRSGFFAAPHRPEAFDEHQTANNTKEYHIAKPHQQVHLTEAFEIIKNDNAKGRTQKAAAQ